MYTQYFGLRENPFALSPDPRYLYLSLRHQEALAHLMFGIIEGGGFAQLTGEVGTGKTMMIRALIERLPKNVDTALVLYPFLSVQEFIAAICDDLSVPLSTKADGTKALIDALNRYLLENHARGRRTVLIIDEAQKLSHEVLEQVRLLTNLETTKEKLLQILLIAQPELNNMLAQENLRQLAQRITARYNLKSLLPNETAEYVMHRCRVAGARTPLFTTSALRVIHRVTHGTPRLINVICDRALLGAYGRGKNMVTASIVWRALAEVGVSGQRPRARTWSWRMGAALGVVATVAVGAWQVSDRFSTNMSVQNTAKTQVTSEATPTKLAMDTTPRNGKATNKIVQYGGDVTADRPPPPTLTEVLDNLDVPTTTEAAFASLFGQWRKDYNQLSGKTSCERALKVGLRCVFASGTWNNLRQLNRPAVIELLDANGNKHHMLVSGLNDEAIQVEIDGKSYEFPKDEVDPYWFGKFLILWKPPATGEITLRRGMYGPAIHWLRWALAAYYGKSGQMTAGSDVFDDEVETQVKEFQRRHQLDDDGIVGQNTMILLSTYDTVIAPPLLSKLSTGTP